MANREKFLESFSRKFKTQKIRFSDGEGRDDQRKHRKDLIRMQRTQKQQDRFGEEDER